MLKVYWNQQLSCCPPPSNPQTYMFCILVKMLTFVDDPKTNVLSIQVMSMLVNVEPLTRKKL